MAREDVEGAQVRHAKLKLLQQHYQSFNVLMHDLMQVIGFSPTWMQYDIASYLQHGPKNLMVQAQRGEAKSTITAMFAVFTLIHNPKARVVIVSAGEDTANEIATLVQRLILYTPMLECLRPDAQQGDRTSVKAFDVHYSLKGIDKSPSVACVGIGSNLPGKRADLVIADDIESPKNSGTAGARQMLADLSREFSAWVTNDWGRIVYLGTPQSTDSVYNTLPGRGFDLRIWPGRFPTAEELPNYGQFLAPSLRRKLEENPSLQTGGGYLGDKGQPTDPDLFHEEKLISKWNDWAESGFQLQFMLNTKVMDALRYPLKPEHLVVLRGGGNKFPVAITRSFDKAGLRAFTSSGYGFSMSTPHSVSETLAETVGAHMRIDPAGGGVNGDETAYAVTDFLNGNIFLMGAGGVPGGYGLDALEQLAEYAKKYNVKTIAIEKNMGHGAFSAVWLPILRRVHPSCSITDDFVTGHKEKRICGTLEPVMGRGSLIVLESVVEEDDLQTARYPADKRMSYSLFHQIAKMTRVTGALQHDDRVDALEGAVRYWLPMVNIDQEKHEKKLEAEAHAKFIADPLGHNRYKQPSHRGGSLLNRYRR